MSHRTLCTLLLCALASPAFADTTPTPEMGAIEIVNLTNAEMHLTQLSGISDIFADSQGNQPIPGIVVAAGQRKHLYVRPVPLAVPAATFGASGELFCLFVARETPASRPTPPERPVFYTGRPLSSGVSCDAEPTAQEAGVTWAGRLTIR